MKNVKVLGVGCANCRTTVKRLETIAHEKGVEIQLEKVEDMEKIMSYGIMSTPGVVIDGQLKHVAGRQPVVGTHDALKTVLRLDRPDVERASGTHAASPDVTGCSRVTSVLSEA